ncbi:MAG: Flp pilus assembly protein TadG [Gammaproteobacteria bacterium]|jgi:Flp pilus assembly protein TadG
MRAKQHGSVIIEFAIVAPLLFLLVFAVSELGVLIQRHETLIKTVRNAARFASEETVGSFGGVILTAPLITSIENLTVYGNIGGGGNPLLPGFVTGDVTVTTVAAVPNHVQVTATYSYQPFLGGAGLINAAVPMTATTIMRALL